MAETAGMLDEAARQRLFQRLVRAEEQERGRIARELHDEMGQYLTALQLALGSLRTALRDARLTVDERGDISRSVQRAEEITQHMAREVRVIATRLRPSLLDDLGIRAAIEFFAEEWQRSYEIPVALDLTGLTGERLPECVETLLYRSVQECLTNVARHAGARFVRIVVDRDTDGVELRVQDDGRGFDPKAVLSLAARPEGRVLGEYAPLGLLGMRERAFLAGGYLTVESRPGAGTTVCLRVPVRPELFAEDSPFGGALLERNLRDE